MRKPPVKKSTRNKYSRRLSVKKQERSKECFDSHGNRLCRFCQNRVHPPRRTFCSDECVHEWKIRSDTKYMRSQVYERDLGICSMCNVDTRYTKIHIENFKRSLRNGAITVESFIETIKNFNITSKESEKSLWHADHIKPVFLGGGQCGLDNIRTLCVSCHKSVTKKSRLAKRNK